VIRFASEYLDGNYRLFELVIASFESTFDQKPEEAAHALIPQEPGTRQNAFQLAVRRLGIDGRV